MKTTISIACIIIITIGTFLFYDNHYTQIPADERGKEQLTDLPWQITIDARGNSNIFGVTLGESSLESLEEHFGHVAKTRLFRNRDGSLSVEAYFEKITLSHIDSRVIVELDVPAEVLQKMQVSATKPKIMPSGTYRFTPSESDQALLKGQVISSLTYAPVYLRLDEEMIQARFGKHKQVIETPDDNSHFLYPEKGLDIVRSPKGKLILQYVSPHNFSRLMSKLSDTN